MKIGFQPRHKQQEGQIIIILLLVIVVILAIALSIASRSATEITNSTNTENSSRAFSAAEAGIEKILQQSANIPLGDTGDFNVSLENQASANVAWDAYVPKPEVALEYHPFGKESFAQFWLAAPSNIDCAYGGAACYTGSNFEVYFGDINHDYSQATGNPENQPAIEVHLIYKEGGEYKNKRYFYDSYNSTGEGRRDNKFNGCSVPSDPNGIKIFTNNNIEESVFYCKVRVPPGSENLSGQLIMARIRMLYTDLDHPVALRPTSGSLPIQASVYRSIGTSGNVQRRIEVFREKDVMPQFFDYVLFSNQELEK